MELSQDLLMERALELAQIAFSKGEVPIGALIFKDGEIIAESFNEIETKPTVTAHAELLCIEQASNKLINWRLNGAVLVVTLEPCSMCMTAIKLSRISKVIFGAYDPRYGAAGSVIDIASNPRLGAVPVVVGGVLQDKCGALLKSFFIEIRKKKGGV